MRPDDASLPDDLAIDRRQIREQADATRQRGRLIAGLQRRLEQLLRQHPGRKGKGAPPDQLLLFALEALAQSDPVPPATRPSAPAEASPGGRGRELIPAGLPRRRIVHAVPREDRAGPGHGPIGEEARQQLEYVPASLIVVQHVRPKYARASYAAHVVIAPRPPVPIEKGPPGTGLPAHVVTSKLADHLPFYRQEGIFGRRAGTLDDVRLARLLRRAGGADRQGDGPAPARVHDDRDRRHAGDGPGPRRQELEDGPALGLPWRAPTRS